MDTFSAALQGLLSRHSVGPRWLAEPGPDTAQLRQAIAAALRAPDHGSLRPWRAVLVPPDQRTTLGELFARCAIDAGKDAEYVETERSRAHNGAVLLAWISRVDEASAAAPAHEQWIAVGGALTNFMNAVHLMGYGAKALSGRKCAHPLLQQAFCAAGERLVCFVCVGTPTKAPKARETDDVDAMLSAWQQPA